MASSLLRLACRGGAAAKRALPQAYPISLVATRQFSTPAEDDIVVAAFTKQQQKFRGYLEGIASVPIPLTPDDNNAVQQYSDAVKKLREKVGVKSFTEKLADLLESAEEDSEDVRQFLNEANNIRKKLGVEDTLGVEPLMYAALDSVEKKLGKPLTTSDTSGLAAFQQELSAVNQKLGMKDGDLEKLEAEVDFLMDKNDIKQLRQEAEEQINTYKRRDHLESIDIDLKELKPTAYL